MVWGKKETYKNTWHRYFVFLPTTLDDGRTIWLGWVERRYSHFAVPGGEVYNYRLPDNKLSGTYTIH